MLSEKQYYIAKIEYRVIFSTKKWSRHRSIAFTI